MSFLARWSVVVAICVAVAAAAVQPVWANCTRLAASAAAGTDEATSSSGFASTPAPDKSAYIGPGSAYTGATANVAFIPSRPLVAWRLPSRATAPSSPALDAPRLPTHLRSIPLLI